MSQFTPGLVSANAGNDKYEVLNPESVKFEMFTSEEVKRMSVLKISTPLTFDALGHPFKGGLYDLCLGSQGSEPCHTCLSIASCPGHLAHIELPVPAVNPLFHKTVHTLLNLSCLHCHRLRLDVNARRNVSMRLRLTAAGLVTDAMDSDFLLSETADKEGATPNEVYDRHVETLKRIRKDNPQLAAFQNKNVHNIYSKFVSETVRNVKCKSCPFCKQPTQKITSVQNRLMTVVMVTEGGRLVKKNTSVMPDVSRDHLRKIWANDEELIKLIVPCLRSVTTDIFFLDAVLVPPPIVRPSSKLKDKIVEHPQTLVYKIILKVCFLIRSLIQAVHEDADASGSAKNGIADEVKPLIESIKGDTPLEKLHNLWQELQTNVDYLITSDKAPNGLTGLKQIIEKKSGTIRCNMMGKRVNFAARSVITPDPNLDTDEIGIPEAIAVKLSYPVHVTPWNVELLRKLVINGPDKHPGATVIENEDGKVISLPAWSKSKREGLAMRLLTPDENKTAGMKIVRRHLTNGDLLLLNRQPTLHKPSIMAHKVRVLKGEKTLRLHYANCKAYNADFDGDEMNAHFPQNEIARSEAYNIMKVNHQYLVPKDGTPLSGLIQDHVISGVRLTLRGRFFTKTDYQQLVFQGLSHLTKPIKLLPPTILKPQRLWSGKQVLSTLIINITPDQKMPISLIGSAKINSRAWQTAQRHPWKAGGTAFFNENTMSESEVIIRQGELLAGVLDKSHFGATPYSLVHCFYELYGGMSSSTLLSSFSKLFTYFLQWEGFTLGVKDILVIPTANATRSKVIKECRTIGITTASQAAELNAEEVDDDDVKNHLEKALTKDPKFKAVLDRKYKTALDKYTNSINKACLPLGLLSRFPSNNLQLMVQSGAKGSTVNTMQISCLLGQIELEGKRPPIMVSGRSLPSFPPYDTSPRAGGFVDGRFMTGIQPQEFFFHCMAGREGLIDTAVKTSKSGYLQRCLIKHLEGIKIAYDMTVRDSDNSVIQFAYGEDGMDVCKVQYMNEKQLKFLDLNTEALIKKEELEKLKESSDLKMINKHNKLLTKWKKKEKEIPKRSSAFLQFTNLMKEGINFENYDKFYDGRSVEACNLVEAWKTSEPQVIERYKKKFSKKCPDPLTSILPQAHNFKVVNEKLSHIVESYLNTRDNLVNAGYRFTSDATDFSDMMWMKSMESLAAPGEPVGLLAAQSIGEPSTQMTLNTFHFAGRGDMNVTLGIPRLREILMMASNNLKTPTLDIPFKTGISDFTKKAEKLQRKFCRVTVDSVLHKVNVHSELRVEPSRDLFYEIEFHFLPKHMYKDLCNVSPKQIIKHMENHFFNTMFSRIWKASGKKSGVIIGSKKSRAKQAEEDDDGNKNENIQPSTSKDKDESSDDEAGNDDDDNTEVRLRHRRNECQEYDDPESDEEEASDKENMPEEEEQSKDQEDEGFEEDIKPDVHSLDVINKFQEATNYSYDQEKHLWCKLSFNLPVHMMKIDLTAIIRSVAERSVIREVANIKRAIIYPNTSGEFILKTEGINMIEVFQYDELLNLNKLYSNDIHAVARTYGIEAACKVIVKEVQNVFGVYGIQVDFRHLSLISDYMTYNGVFEPLSRKGMESSASPLQQMSFESSLTFLKEAALKGKLDYLTSASSCLMLGQPCKSGTGAFTLCNSYDETS